MITFEKQENGVLFTFENSDKYLYGDGTILVPFNSLAVIQDESDMITLRKSASWDIFLSGRFDTDFNYGSKEDAVDALKEALFDETGGGVTEEEVQQMIDAATSGIPSSQVIEQLRNDVNAVSGEVDTKVDTTTYESGQYATAQALNALQDNKLDASAYTPTDLSQYWTSGQTQEAINAATSGIPSSQVIEALRSDLNTVSGDVENKQDELMLYAENVDGVTQEVTIETQGDEGYNSGLYLVSNDGQGYNELYANNPTTEDGSINTLVAVGDNNSDVALYVTEYDENNNVVNDTVLRVNPTGVTINDERVLTELDGNEIWYTIDEKEEVIASALTELNEAIGDPYQKVSGITIDANNEGDVPSPFISIEKVEGSNSNYTYISDSGLESTFENNDEGSNYSSYIGQGSIGNSATDYPDDNVTSERNLEITTDGFMQTTDENYDDGESSYTRYSSDNEFNYSSGLQLHQYWYDEKNDSETNSYINIVNSKEGDTYIELTDTNERTVSIAPNMLSWDDGRDRGDIEWSNIASLDDIPEYSAGTGIEISGNVISATGGGGSGVTPSEVQEMIDESISGKVDTSAITAVNNVLTAHTADTTIHVTTAQTEAWNAKANIDHVTQSEYNAMVTAGTLDSNTMYIIDDAVPFDPSTKADTSAVTAIANDVTVISGAVNDKQDALSAGTGISISNNVISTSGVVFSQTVTQLVKLTQSQYDNLATKDSSTLYIISD